MENLWIYRLDGTIQCRDIPETTLAEDQKLLESLIGAHNVLKSEKRYLPTITVCNAPTGACNAFEITHEGWWLLNHGIAGNPGFRPWNGEFTVVTQPDSAALAKSSAGISVDPDKPLPKVIEELLGRRPVVPFPPTIPVPPADCGLVGMTLRTYETDDKISQDWNPERVNIELAPGTNRIVGVWIG